jgi:predicted DNA-binding transcriptional regulator AlpA
MMNGSASAATSTLVGMSPELAGLAEIAEMLEVTKRTAWNYTQRDDFPQPVDRLASGPIWRRADVETWGTTHLPLPPGRRPQAS